MGKASNQCRRVYPSLVTFLAIISSASILFNVNSLYYAIGPKGEKYARNKDPPESAEEEDRTADFSSALKFVLDRKEAYQSFNKTFSWPMRGIGYLFERHNVILLGKLVSQNLVRIHNVKSPVDCSKLEIWVRVNGPEIFAGHANAICENNHTAESNICANGNCYWEFEFDAIKSGSYTMEAKVLSWDPNAVIESGGPVTCETSSSSSLVDKFLVNESFVGFKMFHPVEMCCEICSRLSGHCKAWSNPIPAFPRDKPIRRGCTLYFTNTSDYAIPYSTMLNGALKGEAYQSNGQSANVTYGLPHNQPTSYFIGCGWSFWFTLDFPCISSNLDDRIFFRKNTFNLLSTNEGTDSPSVAILQITNKTVKPEHFQHKPQPQSMCTIHDESVDEHKGRWIREPWPTERECPHPMEQDTEMAKFGVMKYDGNHPHCWHRDDFSQIGNNCIESNCKFINKDYLWRSSIHQEKQWYGHWQHGSGCFYSEFTDNQLQSCVNRRKIYSIKLEGKSIASFLNQYMIQRLKNINLYNNSHGDGTSVTLSTLAFLHYCSTETQHLRNKLEDMQNISTSTNEEFYWVNGYFLSSEREFLCSASRMMHFNRIGEQILQPKGYKMINAFDMSAAFTYDTATQNDGMHIIGPTMKMIITKLFHFLCFDEEHDSIVDHVER